MRAAAFFCVLLGATQAHAQDRWWGQDKALHLGVSALLAGGGYAASSLVLDSRVERVAVGAGVALSAGIVKEAYDELDYGGGSYKDLVFDVAGVAAGVVAAWLIDLAVDDDKHATPVTTRGSGLTLQF